MCSFCVRFVGTVLPVYFESRVRTTSLLRGNQLLKTEHTVVLYVYCSILVTGRAPVNSPAARTIGAICGGRSTRKTKAAAGTVRFCFVQSVARPDQL